MPSTTTHLIQRIQEGLPLQVRIEQEMAWIEEGTDCCSRFPVHPQQKGLVEGTYEATLEVARAGRFLMEEEIVVHPLRAWLNCQEAAVRLVLNRDPQGGPLTTAPFDLEGIEIAVRPTLPVAPGGRVIRMASLLPCREMRFYTCAGGGVWKVVTLNRGERKPKGNPAPRTDPAPQRDRFSELAAVLPTRPSARPFGGGVEEGRKHREDFEGFRMRTV